ncbi:MAG TPA: ATP-binding protein [Rhizomicrobium sp.]|jgi:signal transduction histidine kinase|nr:ATP-binding protein [Rhizomicrobium sp.]
MRAIALRHSIGTKLFGAFFAMSVIIAGLGAYGYYVLTASGKIVADTYDYPMMAINFARAASVDFLEMQNNALRANATVAGQRAEYAKKTEELAGTLFDDLDIAQERATAADEHKVIGEIRTLVREWQSVRHAALARNARPNLSALNTRILDRFDLLIELNADHGFVSRREAVTHVQNFEYAVIGMTVVALLLAGGITIFLARRIVRPLSAAATVADRIAAGELQTPIPPGMPDETGALLNSMTVMQSNIAERMAREQARAESAEGRLFDAVESSDEGVILATPDGHIALANSEVAKFFPPIAHKIVAGLPLSGALALMEKQFNWLPTEDHALADLIGAARTNASVSSERQLLDGRWLRFNASRTSEGGIILFLSDFTEIKSREESYRVAKQQAEAASAAKSRFVANMSHELRTPLNAIIGFSEIISGQLFGALGNARYADYAQDILRSGRHLLDIINSVLDLAKSEAGKMALSAEPVDLRYVLLDCVKMLREQCAAAGLTLVEPRLNEEIIVAGEKAKLRQIFLNLLSNSIKFTERGGEIVLDLRATPDSVTVEVRDTGIGMAVDDISVALTPFSQVDNRLERRYEGAGLGLPLAKSLADLHGAAMTIESTPGKGTAVFVRFARLKEIAGHLAAAG